MTPEFWAIIGVGVALGTLTVNGHRRIHARLDRDIGGLEARIERDIGGLDGRMDGLEKRLDRDMKELGERIGRVEAGVAELRERVAYVAGVLEGLRDALVGRGVPVPPKPRRAGG